jgi:6-phosphofructokinase 1
MEGTVNKFEDVGVWLKGAVADYFRKHPDPRLHPVSIKYVDPTYMVRSVRANAADNVYCTVSFRVVSQG